MQITRGPEAYYLLAKEILEESSLFKVIAKTPTLFLTSQMIHDYQKSYLSSLLKALRDGQTFFEYLFSLLLTKEELLRMNSEEALQSIEIWRKYSTHPRIDLRYINDVNPFSCCIGDKRTVVLWPYGERAAIIYENQENPLYLEHFDRLFTQASKDHQNVIKKIRVSL
jgi:hypothetical protein